MISLFVVSIISFQLNATSVQIIPLESTPLISDMKIGFHTNNEVLTRNNPLYLRVRSYLLGVSTYSPSLMGMRQSPLGTTLAIFFNGDQRIYLRKVDVSNVSDSKLSFEKDFRKYLPSKIAKELQEGKNGVTVVAVNSYGESMKKPFAIETRIIDYGKRVPRNHELEEKMQKPYILYNEPTGRFMKGEPVLLDFISLNTSISPKGNHVIVKIDGEEIAKIEKNVPHKIMNLPRGKHLVSLTLVDSSGKPYPLPFKPQEKSIVVD